MTVSECPLNVLWCTKQLFGPLAQPDESAKLVVSKYTRLPLRCWKFDSPRSVRSRGTPLFGFDISQLFASRGSPIEFDGDRLRADGVL